jgi:hypothetical protein
MCAQDILGLVTPEDSEAEHSMRRAGFKRKLDLAPIVRHNILDGKLQWHRLAFDFFFAVLPRGASGAWAGDAGNHPTPHLSLADHCIGRGRLVRVVNDPEAEHILSRDQQLCTLAKVLHRICVRKRTSEAKIWEGRGASAFSIGE